MLLTESLLGSSSAVAANYIEDVFSTYLYTGTGSAQTITNDVDLSTKGGMVWLKDRSAANPAWIMDTTRGTSSTLQPSTTGAAGSISTAITAFNTTGFTIGTNSNSNTNGNNYVSWTFREQANFFDVVTYTGTGANRTVSHNLGSVPGCIIVKRLNSTGDWITYHRSLGNTDFVRLNTTAATAADNGAWNNTTPTSTEFSLGTGNTNVNGGTYVAYLFAHDAGGFGAAGTDNVISCGSYTGNGAASGGFVSLGYEPQWLLIKNASAAGDWVLIDNMRGMAVEAGIEDSGDALLIPNSSQAEIDRGRVIPAATGFTPRSPLNDNTNVYIYIAIRRGPMKTPTTGTSVFTPVVYSGTGLSGLQVTTNIITDMVIGQKRTGTEVYQHNWTDRLRGSLAMIRSPSSGAELNTADWIQSFALMNGVTLYNDASVNESGTNNHVMYGFRRAPGFFDVVCYTGGTGSPRVLNHNLGAVPELLITKVRNFTGEDWVVHYNNGSSIVGGYLNNTAAFADSSTAPSTDVTSFTSTTYTLNTTNRRVNGAYNYVAYIFATVAGVSKVGSYTGSGTTKQIDCGFTGGARFVLIKRTDDVGDWYVWDSARGIVAGNDPYLLLNSTAAETTNTDYIDTYSAGFEISSTAPAAINANGGSFIYLAIA